MVRRVVFAVVGVVVCATGALAGPKYNCDFVADQPAIQATGEELASACICAEAATPGEYRRCVTGVLNGRVRASLLSKGCARYVKTIYIPSVCGYPAGTVACARRSSGIPNTRPQCRIVRSEALCIPPAQGGRACTSEHNCNDAISNFNTNTNCSQTP